MNPVPSHDDKLPHFPPAIKWRQMDDADARVGTAVPFGRMGLTINEEEE
jgi:hypothetical protein